MIAVLEDRFLPFQGFFPFQAEEHTSAEAGLSLTQALSSNYSVLLQGGGNVIANINLRIGVCLTYTVKWFFALS